MITIIYKDGNKEDVTGLFTGRVDSQNYYQVMMFLSGLKTVGSVVLTDPNNGE